ncbi:hypothetical protein ES703_78650 [subsurface metagenome]
MHYSRKPYIHKKFKILELRPCCSCFKNLDGRPLNDLPESKQKEIEELIIKYLKINKKD